MADLIVDKQQPQYKHYCRICKKSFACGQALGGHMRAHGINDNISYMEEEDEEEDEEEEEDHMSNDWAPNANNMYSLRTNPNRLKSCRVCENCGVEFSSWKSFLEHGKCNLEEVDSDVGGSELEEGIPRRESNYNSSKRKRSYRAKVGSIINHTSLSSEEEELAHCLMMLSNGIAKPSFDVHIEESCASESKNEGRIHHLNPYNDQNYGYKISSSQYEKTKVEIPKILFECKACKKVFNSHQALGGHRASHKKVKGCFAAKLDHTDDANEANCIMVMQEELHQYYHNGSSLKEKTRKKEKVHECSICYRVFSSGQALGGHKRCHWITSKNSPDNATYTAVKVDNNLPKDSKPHDLSFHALDTKPQNNQDSQEILLLQWPGGNKDSAKDKIFTVKDNTDKTVTSPLHRSRVTHERTKLATLTELKEMSSSETSSQWLQIGLGSNSSQVGSD